MEIPLISTSREIQRLIQSSLTKTMRTLLTLEALRGGGGQIDPPPLDFFGFKFLFLDRLSKALAQLFLVCDYIF